MITCCPTFLSLQPSIYLLAYMKNASRLYEKIKMSLPNKLCILSRVISIVEKRLSNLFSRIGRYHAWLYRNFYIGRWILTPILSDFVNTSPKIKWRQNTLYCLSISCKKHVFGDAKSGKACCLFKKQMRYKKKAVDNHSIINRF